MEDIIKKQIGEISDYLLENKSVIALLIAGQSGNEIKIDNDNNKNDIFIWSIKGKSFGLGYEKGQNFEIYNFHNDGKIYNLKFVSIKDIDDNFFCFVKSEDNDYEFIYFIQSGINKRLDLDLDFRYLVYESFISKNKDENIILEGGFFNAIKVLNKAFNGWFFWHYENYKKAIKYKINYIEKIKKIGKVEYKGKYFNTNNIKGNRLNELIYKKIYEYIDMLK